MTALFVAASLAATGCMRQMTAEQQRLPMPWSSFDYDDVEYYPPGPEFKQASETAEPQEQSINR